MATFQNLDSKVTRGEYEANDTVLFQWLWQLSFDGKFAPVQQSPSSDASSEVFKWKAAGRPANYWLTATASQAIKQSKQVLSDMAKDKAFVLIYENPNLVHLLYYKDKKVSSIMGISIDSDGSVLVRSADAQDSWSFGSFSVFLANCSEFIYENVARALCHKRV